MLLNTTSYLITSNVFLDAKELNYFSLFRWEYRAFLPLSWLFHFIVCLTVLWELERERERERDKLILLCPGKNMCLHKEPQPFNHLLMLNAVLDLVLLLIIGKNKIVPPTIVIILGGCYFTHCVATLLLQIFSIKLTQQLLWHINEVLYLIWTAFQQLWVNNEIL